jgi:DNA invertase Pin-like site-specific DNA recombinase
MAVADIAGDGDCIAPAAVIRAVQYVRMSTDHQRYSTENQSVVIQQYADKHGMVILRTYEDSGKSGLNIEGREALQRLIHDAQQKLPGFEVILVYDVSRWGRFQDTDEAGYYEFLCKKSGVRVIYCAEQFASDGSMSSVIMRDIKRVMVGEYSRELSVKVFIGQCRLIEKGFRQGGMAGYGLRRVLIDEHGNRKSELRRGEQKSLQTDRVILVPGPVEERLVVNRIYRLFVEEGWPESQIAATLNRDGLTNNIGRPWTRGTVHQVLTNEKYIGNNVFNRTSFKLKVKYVRNAPDLWVRSDGAFEGIVDGQLFQRANAIIAQRFHQYTDQEMVDRLGRLFARTGVLSGLIIDEQEDMPSALAYRTRFGSLLRAYTLVGYQPARDYQFIAINRGLRQQLPVVISDVIAGLECAGADVHHDKASGLITINGEFCLSLVISRCRPTKAGTCRWHIRFDTGLLPDITVVIRMAADNHTVFDYYLFPHIDISLSPLRLAEENPLSLDAYRFDTLDALYRLAARTPLRSVA